VILLFTDFGLEGSYLGEMTAVLRRTAPEVPVVNLMADAPPFRPDLAAYLLAAVAERSLAPGDVLVGVVDPGVGGSREPLALRLDGRWAVGPDNGLFEPMLRRRRQVETFRVAWRPALLSASFHGRDLFAPVAARLARGERHDLAPAPPTRFAGWPDDLPAVVHVDRYGNAVTGTRAAGVPASALVHAGDHAIAHARTFCAVEPGQPFWYANSAGLVEVAVNAGSAAVLLGLEPGTPVTIATAPHEP
jgi:S-adenosyl-L-methionine hydrolase (adenosine-forming)